MTSSSQGILTALSIGTPITISSLAIEMAKDLIRQRTPEPAGLRIGVAGGGCQEMIYSLSFEGAAEPIDRIFDFNGLRIFVDPVSEVRLRGCRMDYEDSADGAGFTFENDTTPNSCGCQNHTCGS